MGDEETKNVGLRIAGLSALVLAFVVVPWLLWGEAIELWVNAALQKPMLTSAFALSVVLLLALDVLLPVPSSLVAVAAGVLLGFGFGSLAVFLGLSLGSLVGYVIGARVGNAVARRMVGEDSWRKAEEWSARYGSSVVLALRPVPVLAEASTFFAGATHMAWRRYLAYSTVANLGVAVVYTGVGDVSAETGHLEVALIAGCLLPGVAIAVAGFLQRKGA